VLLSYEHGLLPANLHYSEPTPNSDGLQKGVLKVVTEPMEFKEGIVALSNFGFGGVPRILLCIFLYCVCPLVYMCLPSSCRLLPLLKDLQAF
jgi:hypothetical protein